MEGWARLALLLCSGVLGMTLIEQTVVYAPAKRGLQGTIAVALGALVLQFAGVI